jgi:hypothetical protein
VHLASIHMDVGMQCVDCHFSQDNHGNGHIYGEVAAAVEIGCKDCHGTVDKYPNCYTSGPAALRRHRLTLLRTPDGRRRFEWREASSTSARWSTRSSSGSQPGEGQVTPGRPEYNEKAARAKLMSRDPRRSGLGAGVPASGLAHSDRKMECYSCHTSWTTSCGGCHLPIEANWKTARHHYEGGETRNYATYNPQVARDDMFMLGHRESAKGGKIAPFAPARRWSCRQTNANREHIYVQQPPISASGYSSQAFNPHYPHTERKTETKTCDDCHLSAPTTTTPSWRSSCCRGPTSSISWATTPMSAAQGGVNAVQVTEWDEPQAVIGSYLQKYAYPGLVRATPGGTTASCRRDEHAGTSRNACSCAASISTWPRAAAACVSTTSPASATRASRADLITAPFSPLGSIHHIASPRCDLRRTAHQSADQPGAQPGDKMRVDNQEQPFHPLYNYAYITDAGGLDPDRRQHAGRR